DSIYQRFGVNPVPYNLLGLTLHLLSSLLVYFIAATLSQKRAVGLLSGLIFVSYSHTTEPLFCIGFVYEVVWVFFALGSVAFFLFYTQRERNVYLVFCAVFATLALFTKHTALIIFALLPVLGLLVSYQIIPVGRVNKRAIVLLTGMLVLAFIGWCLFGLYCGKSPLSPLGGMYAPPSVMAKFDTFLDTIPLLFNPFPYAGYRAGGLLISAGFIAYLLFLCRSSSICALLCVGFLVACLPHAMMQIKHARYLYFPAVFSSLLIAFVVHDVTRVVKRRMFPTPPRVNIFKLLFVFVLIGSNGRFIRDSDLVYRFAGNLCKWNCTDVLNLSRGAIEAGDPVLIVNTPGRLSYQRYPSVQVWAGLSVISHGLALYGVPFDRLSKVDEARLEFDFLKKAPIEPFQRPLSAEDIKGLSTTAGIKLLFFDLLSKRYINISRKSLEEIKTDFLTEYERLQSKVIWTGDMNGDEKVDFLITGEGNSVNVILSGRGRTSRWISQRLEGLLTENSVCGDFDGDGVFDVGTWKPGDSRISVLSKKGQVFESGKALEVPFSLLNCNVLPGDFDGDGRCDLFLVKERKPYILINRERYFEPFNKLMSQLPLELGSGELNNLVGDFDGDGKSDVATVGRGGNVVVVSSSGIWKDSIHIPDDDQRLMVGDFNGDGRDDIASCTLLYSKRGYIWVLLSQGRRGFRRRDLWLCDNYLRYEVLKACDVDGDRKDDVCLYDSGGRLYVCISRGNRFMPRKVLTVDSGE
ncbi:MAG: FG-GAP-like repeat-containing protein, partial [Candidatus Brocadiaceae bacterium]|nr:FG-GAP-like repeat-containing protein [Candidatus Brocadiaceae bacterium]